MTKRLMPMLDDPGESPQLRELLETGRSAQVADYDFEQGLRRHLSQVEAGAALPQWAETLQAGGAATTGALGSSLWLWIGVPLLSAAAISAVVLTTASNDDPVVAAASVQPPMQVAQPVAPETAVRPESEAPTPKGAEAVQPNPPVRRARPATSSSAVASQSAGSPSTGQRRATTPAPAHELPLRTTAPAATASTTAPATATVATRVEPSPRQVPAPKEEEVAAQAPARSEPTPKPPTPPMDEARLEREMGMLAMTQRVLFSDPGRALNLARQGEREFEGSMFTQERQQLLLLSLVKLGRLDEAKRLARPYLARYPHGPFSDRVRRSLATGRVDR